MWITVIYVPLQLVIKIAEVVACSGVNRYYNFDQDEFVIPAQSDPVVKWDIARRRFVVTMGANGNVLTDPNAWLGSDAIINYVGLPLINSVGIGISERVDDAMFWHAVASAIFVCAVWYALGNLPHAAIGGDALNLKVSSLTLSRFAAYFALGMFVFLACFALYNAYIDAGVRRGNFFVKRDYWQFVVAQWLEGLFFIPMIAATLIFVCVSARTIAACYDVIVKSGGLTCPKESLQYILNGCLFAIGIPIVTYVLIAGAQPTLRLHFPTFRPSNDSTNFLPNALIWALPGIFILAYAWVSRPRQCIEVRLSIFELVKKLVVIGVDCPIKNQ
jgi:hypothetical protein